MKRTNGVQLLHLLLLDLGSDLLIYEFYLLVNEISSKTEITGCQSSLVSVVTSRPHRFPNDTPGWPLTICVFPEVNKRSWSYDCPNLSIQKGNKVVSAFSLVRMCCGLATVIHTQLGCVFFSELYGEKYLS